MGHSGLFEEERIDIATAVAWFYEGSDGGFTCWPDGPDAPPVVHEGDIHNTAIMGNWHPYNRIDPDQPQTRIPFLAGNEGGIGTENDDDDDYGYDAEYGMGGDACIHNMARYVAVAPRDASRSLRNLDFGV